MERKPNSKWNRGSLKYPISLPFFSCLLFPKLSQGIILLVVLMPFMGRESNKRGKAAGDPAPTLPVLTQWSGPVGWYCNEIIILKFESAVTQIMKHLEKKHLASSVYVCCGGHGSACEILQLMLSVCVFWRCGWGALVNGLVPKTNQQWKIHNIHTGGHVTNSDVERRMHICHFCPHHTLKNDLLLLPPVNDLCAVSWSLISKSWQTYLQRWHTQSVVSFFIAAQYEDAAGLFI